MHTGKSFCIFQLSLFLVVTGLSAILLLVGVMYYVNAMVVNVNTRCHEWAVVVHQFILVAYTIIITASMRKKSDLQGTYFVK